MTGEPAGDLARQLRDTRLAHREERLRFAIHALDQRVHTLTAIGDTVPAPLLAAIRGFQAELASVKAERFANNGHPHPSR